MSIAAIKFVAHSRDLPETNPEFMVRVALDSVDFVYGMIQRRICTNAAKALGASFPLPQEEVRCICLEAFRRVLRRKQSGFTVVLTAIEYQLRLCPVTDAFKSTCRAISSECFDNILY